MTDAFRCPAKTESSSPPSGSDSALGPKPTRPTRAKGNTRFWPRDSIQRVSREPGAVHYGIDTQGNGHAISPTNPIENAIRPFCVGRRNWLFADTVAGVNASARLYSLIEGAKANGLEPYAYLRHVFTELPKAQSLAEIEALLPTRLDPTALAPDSLQESFLAARL